MDKEPNTYLGDGVYAHFDGYQIVLKANIPVTDVIALDFHTWIELVEYGKMLWGKRVNEEDGE